MNYPIIGRVGGPLGQPIKGGCQNSDGTMRVLKEKCHNCPYRPGSDFAPQLKRIHKGSIEMKELNICHNSFPSDVRNAICRGSYEAYPELFPKEYTPEFIDEPRSMYIVTADNSYDLEHR